MPSASHRSVPGQFPAHPLQGTIGGYSAAGVKPRNDDAIAGSVPDNDYDRHTKGIAACIADGISTGRNSDRAAQLAVMQFTRDFYSAPESWPIRDCAARLITSLNSWFHSQNRSGVAEAEGFVTTFTAIIARSTTAHVVHIGDTRCYRLRAGKLLALTEDHSAAYLGEHEVLTRALGIDADVKVDYRQETMEENDLFILTSDGVHGTLDADRMASILTEAAPRSQAELEAASKALCDAALAAGSSDNVSCMMLRVGALPSETLTEAHDRLTRQAIPPVLKPGNRIDGWRVDEVLHSSTRSLVYLVRRSDHDGQFVLKAPSSNFADNLQYLEGFTLEQWVGRRIDSSQVMKILPGEDSRFLYYVAEHVQGQTLREWIAAHPKPRVDEALPIIASIVSAARVFHRLGMVHRDLKPENIIIAEDGTATIIDFGSVQVAGFAELRAQSVEELPEGSLNYIAPEVLAGREAQNLSDLFSIAAIGWEMLTGKVPFDLERRTALPSAPADWKLPSLERSRPDLPQAVEQVLARALSHAPSDRQQAMSEFVGELRRAQRSVVRPDEFVPLLDRGSKEMWRNWALITTLAALVLAALLFGRLL